MTVDDGTSLDSRQAMEGDPDSQVMLRSLATSLLWWRTAISLVMPVLESAGEGAFALVLGQRSIIELRQDGTFHRTSLRSVLPGGTTQVEIIRTSMSEPLPDGYDEAKILGTGWNNEVMGTVGFKRGEATKRWRFLNGQPYYLTQAGPEIRPKVIVDTTEWSLPKNYQAQSLAALEATRLFAEDIVLVAPHTYSADQHFKAYANWVERGRPPDPPAEWKEPIQEWDPDARPEPVRYATSVPVTAEFGVTGLLMDAQWGDPADLEAARSLLDARYDLRIGIWDLAENPTLRKTLLNVTPVSPAPPVGVVVPAGAAKRAETVVDAIVAERTGEKLALAAVSDRLAPLTATGWIPGKAGQRWLFRLPLTKLFSRWKDVDPFPLAQLEILVAKRSTAVNVFTIMYNQVSLPDYVHARQEQFTRIAGANSCPLASGPYTALWKSIGGWDDGIDWSERARVLKDCTPRWVEVFADLCRECLRVRRESGYRDQ